MAEIRPGKGFQTGSERLLLLLTIIHTLPVIWLTPVAAGSAPVIALLAFGFASLFTFDTEGIALGLMVLIPALIYTALAWMLSWLLGRILARLSRLAHLALLGMLIVALLMSVYFPIYIGAGHSSSSSADLFDLFEGYLSLPVILTYWVSLHVFIVLLYCIVLFPAYSPRLTFAQRWGPPVLKLSATLLLGTVVYSNFATVICRPLAELGIDRAQICVAQADRLQARYWYERAAYDGNFEAITWLIENTPDRRVRLEWLRKGAQAGDPALQFQLARHLQNYGDADSQAEAAQWLERSAVADYGPAQQQQVAELTKEVIRSQPRELLAQRNALLEQAADNGSAIARLSLAEHYTRGSMGHPADLQRARGYYQQLLGAGDTAETESVYGMNHDAYVQRLQQLDTWQAGLAAEDQKVMLELARLYLTSPLPGPGVQELGMQLFESVATRDADARAELIVMLRTGTDGAGKDQVAARKWLLIAAEAGEPVAMDRVASNYLKGAESFPLDYPQARRWIEALISYYQQQSDSDAQAHIASLERHLKYIDRLDELAGGALMGEMELQALAQDTDADAQYRYALQLLAGHGANRRADAVSRLQAAAELGHAEAAWRLVEIYERGFPDEINPTAAGRELQRAAAQNHFYATRELAARYEYGNKGFRQDLPRAIEMYEAALAAAHDNRFDWNLDPDNFNHFRWLESRLKQAKLKLAAR